MSPAAMSETSGDSHDWYETDLRVLDGGYSGETYVAGEPPDAVVVRVYARAPARAAIDAGLLRLVRGLVPVPDVLELRHPTGTTPAVLVTEYVDGHRLDTVLAAEPPWLDLDALGRSLAAVLATLAGIPFLRVATFADADLTLTKGGLPQDLQEWAGRLHDNGRLGVWEARDWGALVRLVDQAEDLLADDAESHPPRVVLVHSDLNPKNILVDPRTSQVVALLDWEFAHAGSRHTDLGNLCRFERDPRLVGPLLAALADGQSQDAARSLSLARAIDLWALLELAGRPRSHPLSELATALLLAQARSGDLHAWPWSLPRVAPGAA